MCNEHKRQEDLEAAKGWLAIAKENGNKIAIQILEKFFPELRESEDEKIIRTLKEIVNWGCAKNISVENDVSLEDCISWLEKQGEQKPADMSIKEKAHQIAWETSKHYDPLSSKQSWCEMAALDMASWLEKQGNQNHTDKVEPKFKVGDYIERKDGLGCHAKIIFVGGNVYGCEKLIHSEDESPFFEFMFKNQDEFQISSDFKQKPADKVEPKFKIKKGKWYVCIKDLLDNYANEAFCEGDTYLSTQDGSLIPSNSNVPYEITCPDTYFRDWTIQDAKDGDVLKEDSCMFIVEKMKSEGTAIIYCCLFDDGDFDLTGSTLSFDVDSTYPATKEQRNILFQKMKEEGYEWDDEKKKLRKIEKNCYHNDGLYYAIDILEKTFGKVEGYQSDDGKMEHQIAIETVKALYHKKPDEWSKEDELNLNQAIYVCHQNGYTAVENWLKSLKPNHWKPSEYDISLLEEIAKNIRNNIRPFCSEVSALEDLIESLKTL